jgi:LacI family transcriptional regulator
MIGLMIIDCTNPFYGLLIRGVQESLNARGMLCLISESLEDSARERKLADFYQERQVDGIIVATAKEDDPTIEYLEKMHVKYIQATRRCKFSTAPSVVFDNYKGVKDAIEYLISLGHTHIAHIAGNLHTDAGQIRLKAFYDTMRHHSLPVRDDYVVEAGYIAKESQYAMKALLNIPEIPTAVLACNDVSAISALKVIHEMKLRVPQDISIIGFNNIGMTENTSPPLTTVHTPVFDLGYCASHMLLDLIDGKPIPNRDILLDTSLVIRNSTGPCRWIKK